MMTIKEWVEAVRSSKGKNCFSINCEECPFIDAECDVHYKTMSKQLFELYDWTKKLELL